MNALLESGSPPAAFLAPLDESVRPERHRKIAILGFAKTVADCPWRDPSWELWGMNGFWRCAKPDFGIDVPEERYSLWLDMHTLEFTRSYGSKAGIGDAQEKWLQQPHPFPILMIGSDPEWPEIGRWPSVRPFPIGEVIARFGRDYFSSSVAYAIALALSMDDVAEIGLWGIDLAHDTEYAYQRPCAEYWVGRAEASGIKVTIQDRSAMLKQRVRYGYEEDQPLLKDLCASLEAQAAGLEQSIQTSQAEMARAQGQLRTDDGALQATRGVLAKLEAWRRGGRI